MPAQQQPQRGREGRDPKTVYLDVGIFANAATGHIHIATSDFITTVCNRPGSQRCHRNLFMKLRRVLLAEGKWPQDMPEEANDVREERRGASS